ncbi:hypothetical protein PM082_015016 [Marasmius tenuissimus]|nr:hypothetical protein PM082_015016 [Marasmius tenuissimus]
MMRVFQPFIIAFTICAGSKTYAFAIEGVPTRVTTNQKATITWSRRLSDPTSFALAKTASATQVGVIDTASVDDFESTGTMVAIFQAEHPVSIVAYDLDQVPYTVLRDKTKTKPVPFFDDEQPIRPAVYTQSSLTTSSRASDTPVSISSTAPTMRASETNIRETESSATFIPTSKASPITTAKKLSSGSIAAIVLGSFLAIALLVAGFTIQRLRRRKAFSCTGPEPKESLATNPRLSTARHATEQGVVSFWSQIPRRAHTVVPERIVSRSEIASRHHSIIGNLEAPRDGAFHLTDSEWMFRANSISEGRNLSEVPPAYSEAGQKQETM